MKIQEKKIKILESFGEEFEALVKACGGKKTALIPCHPKKALVLDLLVYAAWET